jgi:hypothetical protein
MRALDVTDEEISQKLSDILLALARIEKELARAREQNQPLIH